jgi:hypothetical protein
MIAGADIMRECNATPKISTRNQDAHIAVPLMSQLNRSTLTRAPNLKMILQFGVWKASIFLLCPVSPSTSDRNM